MKKKLLALITVLAVMLCLAGCGVNITSISLPESLTVNVGETVDAVATFAADKDDVAADKLAEAASKLELTWTSADESVATVDANGVVTGVAGGETAITVAAADGLSATVKVSVKVPLEGIEIEDIELTTLDKDVEVEYTLVPENAMVESVEFGIADEAIVTAKDGKITAVTAGETELTISCGEIAKTVAVKVLQAPVELSAEEINLTVGETADITVNTGLDTEPEVGTDYIFASSDEEVATVDEDGVVTAVAAGEAEVTVTNELGQRCVVSVTASAPAPVRKPSNSGSTGGTQAPTQGTGTGAQVPASTPVEAPAPTPAPTPAPAEPVAPSTPVCEFCGGPHNKLDCPNLSCSPDVDPSTAPEIPGVVGD